LLDANHGSGGALGRTLLEALGCQVTILGETPTGGFLHAPEPTAENLASVCARIPEERAVIGFCQDPDADRLALIDENGRYVGEEYTLAVILNHVLAREPGPVVVNCATSRMSQDIAKTYHQTLTRSAVGEPNVVDAMIATNAVFGGEGNGGPIDPNVGLIRDSFVGMARVLDAMAARAEPISVLVDELPGYEIVKTKIALETDQIPAAIDALENRFADALANRMDGLRLDWPDAWLLVRGSNTEPIVRAIAEAPTRKKAAMLCEEASVILADFR
jgi:phosphomannomutase